jgi:hypothetical protein
MIPSRSHSARSEWFCAVQVRPGDRRQQHRSGDVAVDGVEIDGGDRVQASSAGSPSNGRRWPRSGPARSASSRTTLSPNVTLREPDLPVARLDGVERELRLLVDHCEDLVAKRTRIICRLRWHLHELDPGWTPPASIDRTSAFDAVTANLAACRDDSLVGRLALRLIEHLQMLTAEIDELTAQITQRVSTVAPSLSAIVGCGPLTAAKIVGETARVRRFRSKDAFARLNGTAPTPVW